MSNSPTIVIGAASGGVGTCTANVLLEFTGSGVGYDKVTLPVSSNANSPYTKRYINLAGGNNDYALTGITGGLIFIPPAGNTESITLKGADADTGIPLHLTMANGPIYFPVGGGTPTVVVFDAGAPINGCYIIEF